VRRFILESASYLVFLVQLFEGNSRFAFPQRCWAKGGEEREAPRFFGQQIGRFILSCWFRSSLLVEVVVYFVHVDSLAKFLFLVVFQSGKGGRFVSAAYKSIYSVDVVKCVS